MRSLVETLCSSACAGRAAGSAEGKAARGEVIGALRGAGLDPYEQAVASCQGANVLAMLPGDVDRWIVVGAHYDHLGKSGGQVFWGADDNAAAVAILVEVASRLTANRPQGRGIVFASFDGEEPPYFLSDGMGSQYFVRHCPVPVDRIDMMICMDLVGHAFGGEGFPGGVQESVFVLGAEKSVGTAAHIDQLVDASPGVKIRRLDVGIIPPLSDYEPFWRREIPFVFLSNGRWRYYHTPMDTPEKLSYPKMAATAGWLERYIRETCCRDEASIRFVKDARDDASTLRSMVDLTTLLLPMSPEAAMGKAMAERLLSACDREGRLPESQAGQVLMLVAMLESKLA